MDEIATLHKVGYIYMSVTHTHTHRPVQAVHKCSATCSHHNTRHHAGLKSHFRATPSVFHTCISNKSLAPTGTSLAASHHFTILTSSFSHRSYQQTLTN